MKILAAVYRQKVRQLRVNRRPRFLTEKLLGEATAEKLLSLTPEEFALFRSKVLSAPGVGEKAWRDFLDSLGVEEVVIVRKKGTKNDCQRNARTDGKDENQSS